MARRGGGGPMKCRRCRGAAVIELRRHNAAFCGPCFELHVLEQVRKAIKAFSMFSENDKILVAVSGGKDSLALWDILVTLGYTTTGLYLGLGIGEYSDVARETCRAFASTRGLELREVDMPTRLGFDIPSAAMAMRRPPCSACGTSKRHLFNDVALEVGADAVATGHNLDDEAAVLFGNVLHWSAEYLGRQHPVLPAAPGFVKKVKPLVRLGEREMAAWCVVRGIDYQIDECPNAIGNRHLGYKEALNQIEERSPGSKAAFFLGFLERGWPRFADSAPADDQLGTCSACGSPTTAEVCTFCRLVERAGGHRGHEPLSTPVAFGVRS